MLRKATLAALIIIAAYWAFAPFRLSLPQDGLDPSWMATLGEASRLGLMFGHDIVFSAGPLSPLYTGYFVENEFYHFLILKALLIAALARLLWLMLRDGGAAALLMPAIILLIPMRRDAVFFSIPLLTALVALRRAADERVDLASILLGVAASAILSLTKFSCAPMALLAFAAIDVVAVVRRRVPFALIAYGIMTFQLFWLWHGRPDTFLPFLRGSFEVAAGYAEAMSLPGPVPELIAYLGMAAGAAAILSVAELRAWRSGAAPPLVVVARVMCVSGFLFLTWKAGFVRHDVHTLVAWSGLAIAVPVWARSLDIRPLWPAGLAGFVVVGAVLPVIFASAKGVPVTTYTGDLLTKIGQEAALLGRFVRSPHAWLRELRDAKEEAWLRLRTAYPLPDLIGTVDTIPSVQTRVIAHVGERFKPRLSVQQYASYTSYLIAGNRRSLTAADGAATLLFLPESIDGRHPALAEGPLWPDIIEHFAPAFYLRDGMLVLRRRERLLGNILRPLEATTARMGVPFALPPRDAPLFAKVKIEKTLLGTLASLLFRPSIVSLRLAYFDGSEESFRIIPRIIEQGMVISPMVRSGDQFALLASGEMPDDARRPLRVTFESGRLGMLLYRPTIAVTISALDVERSALPAQVTQELKSADHLRILFASHTGPHEKRFIPEGLLLHAPAEAEYTVTALAERLEVGFGIAEGAWRAEPGTAGICFALSVRRPIGDAPLWRRCLDPKRYAHDRGEQTIGTDVALKPGDRLMFQTTCVASCDYGWSYWSRIVFR